MAHYSTFRPASASRKALSHAETFGGDPIAPSASWVASVTMHGILSIHTETVMRLVRSNRWLRRPVSQHDRRPPQPRAQKALGLPSAHCTLQVGESGRGKDRPLSASINHDNNSYVREFRLR